MRSHPTQKKRALAAGLSAQVASELSPETLEMASKKVGLSLTVVTLLITAAQEAWMQDPERHWLHGMDEGFPVMLYGVYTMIEADLPEAMREILEAGFARMWTAMKVGLCAKG